MIIIYVLHEVAGSLNENKANQESNASCAYTIVKLRKNTHYAR